MKQMLLLVNTKSQSSLATYEEYEKYEAEKARMAKSAVEQLGEYATALHSDMPPSMKGTGKEGPTREYLEYLSSTLRTMEYQDYVVFGKGWDETRENRILHYIAMEYGLNVVEI